MWKGGVVRMNFDEDTPFGEMAIKLAQEADKEHPEVSYSIEQYLLEKMDLTSQGLSSEETNLLCKNFIHLMCTVIDDLKSIDSRLVDYKKRYVDIKNDKNNAAEFQRRKIEYFCEINKKAKDQILDFLSDGVREYLLENKFDVLKRIKENDQLSVLFLNRRYKYAYYRSFYDMDYDYGASVKVSELHHDEPLERWMDIEKEYLDLKKTNPNAYQEKLQKEVEDKKIMELILQRVKGNFHLSKRLEIFETLKLLFNTKKFQPFIALGLIELEGMFFDYCNVRFGEKENQGTLAEKADKALQTNEYKYMRFYPYFAFDVPIMRNDVAHKGMIESGDLEKNAYDLVLDLNTVSTMVRAESYDKFVGFIMTHEEMLKWESNEQDTESGNYSMYEKLAFELLRCKGVIGEQFWKMLKNPEEYKDEILFYKIDDLPNGQIDLPGMISVISNMVRHEHFWKALKEMYTQHVTKTLQWIELKEFVKFMKNDYISILEGEAKNQCIELAKILK